MSTTLVYVEHAGGAPRPASLEALGAARSLGGDVVAVLSGPDAAGAAGSVPAEKVVVLGHGQYSPDALAADLARLATEHGAARFLVSSTSTGRDVAPRVAALLDSTLFTDCTALEADGDAVQLTRPWLAGKLIATVRTSAPVLCASLRRNCFPAAPVGDAGGAEVIEGTATTDYRALLTEIAAKPEGKLDVSEAPVIVSGGRGLKGPENFHLVEELAGAFGNAAVGASRAVVDAGWRPHSEQVGQTGKTVSPQLYVAVGISGAIQHLAGMKTSKVIVAINKDADAPIFKVADYGIVGDAFEVVPALTEAVRAVRAQG